MPRILISCPNTGEEVPTGHRTPSLHLSEIVEKRAFRCAACGKIHDWVGRDAWEEQGLTPAGQRAAMAAAAAG